jgi:hypothetical protein
MKVVVFLNLRMQNARKEAYESRPLYGGGKSSIPAGCCLLFTTQLLFTFSAKEKCLE